MTEAKPGASGSMFSAFRHSTFTVLWAAAVLGNTGTFMRDVASSWLVTGLSPSPTATALIQAAGTLPIFLLAIPAGVLTDILDRRKFLIGIQIYLGAVSIVLLSLAAAGALTIWSLAGLTFLGGIGAALMAPTWQAIVPELVPKADLKGAVALNSLGINISRAIGPAVGGLLLASAGAAVTYGADVASYVIVGAALLWWKRPAKTEDALTERFTGAFVAGLRYAKNSRELHVVMLRAAVFFTCASSVWALLPLVARRLLGGDAGFYGLLLGAIGLGAIGGALVLSRVRDRLSTDALMLGAALVTAAVMALLALAPPQPVALVLMLALGAAWIVALTTLNSTAQAILPNWVRGRALAIYLTVFNGAMALGSLGWGSVADAVGIPVTLFAGAVLLLVAGLGMHRLPLPKGETDLAPSNHWPEPLLAVEAENDRGPVLVTIEYQIAPEDRVAFLDEAHRLSRERLKDGAYAWGITEDAAAPERLVEWFLLGSWAEHLRQHRRVSNADADIQKRLHRFHRGEAPPVVRHLLGLESA